MRNGSSNLAQALTEVNPGATPTIVDLTGGGKASVDLVGGKGAGLARLAAIGLPIPPAFAVTPQAFQRYCKFNGVSSHDHRCGRALADMDWPPELREDIERALAESGLQRFAVRSSALAEDGAHYSMAGQLDSFLDVPRDEVCRRIVQCWMSLYASRAASYWQRMDEADRRIAVVVQEQVQPEWSGVAFSMEPLSNSCDDLLIEWTHGLGDKLVAGEIVPERLVIPRGPSEIPTSVPATLRRHLPELRRHLLAAEAAFGCLIDVEWCTTNERLWMLQARPITTTQRADLVVWSNVNLVENFPNPLTPLAWSVIRKFYEAYMRGTLGLFGWREREFNEIAHLLDELTGLHHGRIYYNLTSWYGLISYFPRSEELRGFLDTYIGQQIPIHVDPDPHAPKLRRRQQSLWGSFRFFAHLLASFAGTGRALASLEARFERQRPEWRARSARARDPRELVALVDQMLEFVTEQWRGPCSADLMVMMMPGLLEMLLERWRGQGARANLPRLLQGVTVKSDEPAHLLWTIGQLLESSDGGRSTLEIADYAAARTQMPADAQALFDEFLHRFGARCYNDCSLIAPTFEERPELAWQLVRRFVSLPDRFSPDSKFALRADREALLGQLGDGLAPWRRKALRLLVRISLRAIQHREAGRLVQSLMFGELRGVLTRLGEVLAEHGALPVADDVHYCTLGDLADVARSAYPYSETLPQLLAERQARVEASAEEHAPSLFVLPAGEAWRMARHEVAVGPAGASLLHGVAVSRGKVRGRARVVRDPSREGALEPGDILVAPSTDPGWTPLFMLAGGLILERGGLLSHGAIIARELGIPALVEVRDACTLIESGASVEIDAAAGTVRIG